MGGTATRYLYLVRHAEALPGDGGGLSANGRRQAELLGRRLRGCPLSALNHGPLTRAAQTAQLIAEQLDGVPRTADPAAGDYLPYLPQADELPLEYAEFLLGVLDRFTAVSAEEVEQGAALAREAVARFTGPVAGGQERHELLVTHNYLAAWLVRQALDAPNWRWLTLNHANTALTVIRYTPGLPPTLLTYNDTSHLATTRPLTATLRG
ncbi:histidine phosphatase family protein [Streptacidiphilus sp. P02-A3a]|uniref:histidine phosphatase family protein n=1 Tax=Streptacidiphilus sp. P02-A3a TaxID=2704468 RepID=UPI0015FCFE5C|nr:histidine phosphatase family protein [Streptacidiphilus sp. P02-A3a]QMU73098.1 histidine phosphatase family protein [Streptacidiphilus sp. P02-A3a]